MKLRFSVSFAIALVAAITAAASVAKPTDAATCDITLRDLHVRRSPGAGPSVLTATYTNTPCGNVTRTTHRVRVFAAGRFIRDIALPPARVGTSARISVTLPANVPLNHLSFTPSALPTTRTATDPLVSVTPSGLASPGSLAVSRGYCIRPNPDRIVLRFPASVARKH